MTVPDYAFLAVFFAFALAFPLILLGISWLWRRKFTPQRPGAIKNSIYESGVESKGPVWIQFKAHYYLYAILFLIFDVEIVFLLPFAVAFTGLSVGAIVTMLVFVLLLAEGLVWAWARGHLEWK
ncbi:MAG TPA: NADH-quinone oxidoreductase subunit A [Opitutaceae bacterium]|nr:NADH-quinone oxidoreductase subunit A [Opitutaceae bacterium]